ncbi:MAG: DUF4411 family protein [Planctomycetes bacterium]|nr:DUF4411 family protein [Planctomycetota bacterium]
MKYSIDTSGLLDGWVRYYPPDLFPSLWDGRFDELIEEGRLIATEEVLIELEKKEGDAVHAWAQKRSALFVPVDEPIQACVTDLLAQYPYLAAEQSRRSSADPFVIALAQIEGCAVVTGEHPSNNLKKPKIPDVCADQGILCLGLPQVFREEGWVFRT